jgi:type IV secretion system protein VirB10
MRMNARLRTHIDPAEARDPRELQSAEVIDLTTRSVLPAVTQRKRGDSLGLVAGIAIVAGLGALTLWTLDSNRREIPAAPTAASAAPASEFAAPTRVPPAPVAKPATLPAPAPQPVLSQPPQIAPAAPPVSNPNAAPTMVYDDSGATTSAQPKSSTAPGAGNGNSNDDFASRLGVSNGSKATASATFDPRTTVTQGTLIPAVLETAIDTDVPGYVRAIVSSEVRSFDGSNVLIPRSSRLIGQYKSGLQAGQKRAYVIWTRLIRPDGVSVDLASPPIGYGGETGLAGKVNSHFFARFGSALLLSVVGGLSALGGNASVIIGGGGQSAAAAAVGQSGQIGPTVRIRQGQPIRVFTAKDLDFSQVTKS